MSNFFFCHYVFKKPSAAEASESVYMRERVKNINKILNRAESIVTKGEILFFRLLQRRQKASLHWEKVACVFSVNDTDLMILVFLLNS